MARCMAALIHELSTHQHMLGTPERAHLLLAAAQCPVLSHPEHASLLLGPLCATILEAPVAAQQVRVVELNHPLLLQDSRRYLQPR
jgi:hypothetical protein